MTQRFAVDGNVLEAQSSTNLVQPAQQGGLQGLGLEPIEDPLKGVVRGNAVGQFQEALQPIPAFASEGFAVGPGIGAGEDSADGDGEDVAQQVPFAAVDTGVLETAKVLVQGQT